MKMDYKQQQVWNFCTKSQRGFLQNFDLNVDFCKVEVLNFFLINDGERSEPQNVNRQRTARLCQMVHWISSITCQRPSDILICDTDWNCELGFMSFVYSY
eukprot:313787_1